MKPWWGLLVTGTALLASMAASAGAEEPAAPLRVAPKASASAAVPAPIPVITQLHRRAAEELHALVQPMDKGARDRLVGAYVAFNGTTSDLGAMAACDDDGDYVVTMTDGLLMLIDAVALAQASDEVASTKKLDAYAAFLAKAQRPNAKLVPPPVGFFEGTETPSPKLEEVRMARLRDAIAGVIAHEVAHMLSSDVTCRHPTATHEGGDDTWTASEQSQAEASSSATYTQQRVLAADTLGTELLLEAGRSTVGLMATLTVIDRLERGGREGYAPSYIRSHAGTAARMQWVEAAASHYRYSHAVAR